MGQLEDLRVFVAIVDSNGISRAAEELHIAKSAVSRRLSQLEDRYEVRLIDRERGAWMLTDAGRELYQRALRLVNESDELDADFKQPAFVLAGPLAVSVPAEFGLAFLQATLVDFQTRHPEIQFSVDFDDRRVDLDRENYDIAIRITDTLDSELVEQPLGKMCRGLFASPEYIKGAGMPRTFEELAAHRLLYYGKERRCEWVFGKGQEERKLTFTPALNSNSGQFLYQATLHGLGISRLPLFIANEAKQDGRLITLLPELQIRTYSISLVYPSNRRVNQRMRVFAKEMSLACEAL
ncbi:MAG: LysR family transcriptional regulator [Pseudomonadota bacterium]